MSQISQNFQSINQNLKSLKILIEKLNAAKDIQERLQILNQNFEVREFLEKCESLKNAMQTFNESGQFILKSLLAIGQGPIIFQGIEQNPNPELSLKQLVEKLEPVERFYDMMGGVIGYHVTMLGLILEKELCENDEGGLYGEEHYHKPPGYDLTNETPFIHLVIKKSIENLPLLAEIYPVGGAGDRLKLQDEKTGEDLPSAELSYEGRTLLEGLIRDLQAREYLYYKLFGKQILVPIAMMTSDEKNNHQHLLAICNKQGWFGRPRDSYNFFKQPLVPLLTEHGDWALSEPMKLFFKPGGHGVLWKLALDAGVIDRLLEKGCTKALIRQINNPIAGTDYGLLAFSGCGFLNDQIFGFASCPRLLNTAEGMNVLVERRREEDYEYCISNIEYPDFVKKHIKDISEKPGSPFSAFPANTNILFFDLKAIKEIIHACPVPGMLINMKTKVICLTKEGKEQEVFSGRLESLMQNIADVITNRFSKPQKHFNPSDLLTFLTYNTRRKTISVTKKLYTEGQPMIETPEGCYYDQLHNHHELFTHHCKMKLPDIPSKEEYIKKGPSFVTAYHPALGPLYSIIAQKIQGGSLGFGSEMILEIAELELHQVDVLGSLLIYAENIAGHKDDLGIICYSEHVGRCTLRNVKIKNQGMDQQQTSPYWKGQVVRKEAFKIVLKGKSEFIAEDVTFTGLINVEVPDGYRMTAHEHAGKLTFDMERLTSSNSYWKYSFDKEDKIYIYTS